MMPNLSRVQNLSVSHKTPRNPKCARCRNHGLVAPQKGHAGKCQFVQCGCWKCSLISERTKIMAIQRKIKKAQKEECSSVNGGSRPGIDDGGPVDREVPVIMSSATSGLLSPVARTETVIHRPPRRFEEADGKTYAELEVSTVDKPPVEGGSMSPWPQRKPAQADGDHGGEEDRTEGRYGFPHWNGDAPLVMSLNASHFPGEYVIAEVAQREAYRREMVAMPLPFKLFPRYPNAAYAACPAILVNMPHLPPGFYKDGPLGFPHFSPGPMHYPPPEPGPTHDGRVPFFAPHPSVPPGSYQEEVGQRQPPPQPSHPEDRGSRAGGHPLGSQGSEENSVENDPSSQDTI